LWALYYCGHISNILGNEQDAVVVYNKALRYIQELEEYWEETPIYSMETKSIGRRQITTVHKELYSVEIDVRQIKYAIKSVLRNIQHSDRKKSDRANADFLISKELSAINRFLEWNRPGEALEKFFQLLKSHSNSEDLWREFYSFIRKNRDYIEASTWIPVLEKIVNLSPSRLAILPVLAGCYKETSNPEREAIILKKLLDWKEMPKHLYRYGQLLIKLGQPKTGDRHIRRATSLDPSLNVD
jgi:tetratricopeptide (TPR) repeat protein